jgi:hypothetical protein
MRFIKTASSIFNLAYVIEFRVIFEEELKKYGVEAVFDKSGTDEEIVSVLKWFDTKEEAYEYLQMIADGINKQGLLIEI